MFNTQKFAMAGAVTSAILYVVCAVFVALWPSVAIQLLGSVTHIVNVDKFAGEVKMTFGGVLVGFVEIVVYTYVAFWIFAALYNRSVKSVGK